MYKYVLAGILTLFVTLVTTITNAEVLFSEDFESYAEGSNLFGQGGWDELPFQPQLPSTTLVGIGSGLGTVVANGRLNTGTGDLGYIFQSFEAPSNTDVYILSFDGYGYSTDPQSHVSGLCFYFVQKFLCWQVQGNFTGRTNVWRFTVDNLTGSHADNQIFSDGLDKPVKFQIIVDAGNKEFFGRYDFGSGYIETNHFAITPLQLSEFEGITLFQDYRRPTLYLGFEVDNLLLEKFTSIKLSCLGFESPLYTGSVRVRKNRALPIKGRLFDSDGNLITDMDIAPPVIKVIFTSSVNGVASDVTDDALHAGSGTDNNQFVYNSSTGQWQFNLKTKNYDAPGTYVITIASGDSSDYLIDPTCSASFIVE